MGEKSEFEARRKSLRRGKSVGVDGRLEQIAVLTEWVNEKIRGSYDCDPVVDLIADLQSGVVLSPPASPFRERCPGVIAVITGTSSSRSSRSSAKRSSSSPSAAIASSAFSTAAWGAEGGVRTKNAQRVSARTLCRRRRRAKSG